MPGVGKRETKTVSLTPEPASFLTRSAESGRYRSASEVVRAAPRLLQDAEAQRANGDAQTRAMIAEGAAQLDRGEAIDGGEVFRRLAEKHAKLRKTSG
jgi:antitoxin ParD1/3/4